ncbi:MAG: PAS domain-containing protein [Propionivibrio sp.]
MQRLNVYQESSIVTTEKRSMAAATQNLPTDDEEDFPVKAAIRRLGATEDIRAYVYRTLIDIMPDRIYAKDLQSRFILANRSVARLMGKSGPDELIGKTDFDFYPPEMAAEFMAVEREIFQTGEPLIALEQFTPNLHTGEPEWTQTTKVPLRDFEGDVIGLVGIARDVTLRKRREDEFRQQHAELEEANARLGLAYEQLVRSEQLAGVGHLASGVAREIGDPLGRVFDGFNAIEAHLAEVGALLDALAARHDTVYADELQRIRRKADLGDLLGETREGLARVGRIVQDLQDFSIVEAGGEMGSETGAEWGEMDLNHAIDSALNILAGEIGRKAKVAKEFGELPGVRCVAAQINQVIVNLLVNAAQAIEAERGTITARTGIDGEDVWFEISDTGSGIGQDVLKRIFEPFFTTKPAGQGTGLGLPLSLGIVQSHGGRIEVSSEVGQGSRFRVRLPRQSKNG